MPESLPDGLGLPYAIITAEVWRFHTFALGDTLVTTVIFVPFRAWRRAWIPSPSFPLASDSFVAAGLTRV